MKHAIVSLVVIAACGSTTTAPQVPKPPPAAPDLSAGLVAASAAGDVAKVRAIVRKPLTNGGMWFADMACAQAFSAAGPITEAQLDAFAPCLAGLHLTPSTRKDELDGISVLAYAPGMELEARFLEDDHGPWLAWIGFVARRGARDSLPTITAEAFEALRASGNRNGPLPPDIGESLLANAPHLEHDLAFAWLKVCLDTTGALKSVHARTASSKAAADAFTASAKAWTFKPFLVGDAPIPVCSMTLLTYPPKDVVHQDLPLPLLDDAGDALAVPSEALGPRLSGDTQLAPSDSRKVQLDRAGIFHLTLAFEVCLDASGGVAIASPIQSSGLHDYDADVEAAIRQWQYAPYAENNTPVHVCTHVTFRYAQAHAGGGRP